MMRYQEFQTAVMIPLAQSGVTGTITGLLALSLAWAAQMDSPAVLGALAATTSHLVTWLILLRRWYSTMEYFESLLDTKVNTQTDHQITVEAKETPNLRLDITNHNRVQILDLPIQPEQLHSWADGLANGLSLSESTWTGSGKLFSTSEYRSMRDTLIQRGLARWKNPGSPKQGWELTVAGRAVVREAAVQSLPYHTSINAQSSINPESVRTHAHVRTENQKEK